MLEVVRFQVVEKWSIAYLTTQLDLRPEPYAAGVHVSNTVPRPRADRMVTVRQDGGPDLTVASRRPRLGVNVYALTDSDVDELADLVQSLLKASPGEGPVRDAAVNGKNSLPDDEDHKRRYFTAELVLRSL